MRIPKLNEVWCSPSRKKFEVTGFHHSPRGEEIAVLHETKGGDGVLVLSVSLLNELLISPQAIRHPRLMEIWKTPTGEEYQLVGMYSSCATKTFTFQHTSDGSKSFRLDLIATHTLLNPPEYD